MKKVLQTILMMSTTALILSCSSGGKCASSPSCQQTPGVSWSKQVGGVSGRTNGNGVTTDSSGNIYVAGTTNVGISGQTLQGASDYYVAKYDSNQKLLWTKEVGASGGDTSGNGVATDSSGNVYIVGTTTVGISGQTHKSQEGYSDYFIAKYDNNGNLQWTEEVGSDGQETGATFAKAVVTDSSGNIYVTGGTFVNITQSSQSFSSSYFVAKYNGTGTVQWIQQFADNENLDNVAGLGVAMDNNGNIYVTGSTSSLDGTTTDYFVAKHDNNGNLLWNKEVGASASGGDTEGNGVATDSGGNIYITGKTSGGISGQMLQGIQDYFIAKYDISGELLWTKEVGASVGDTEGNGVATDSSGNIYITGSTNVAISSQTLQGGNDYFAAKYDSSGNLLWTKEIGASKGYVNGNSIAVTGSNIYVTGDTNVSLSCQIQSGLRDYFVAQLENN